MTYLRALLGTALVTTTLLALHGTASARPQQQGAAAPTVVAAERPDIVLITTDDQTLMDLAKMPITRRLLKEQGVTFSGISPHPLCCPARAEILTGQFAQNNGVRSNVGEQGGYQALDTSSTVATWLRDAGYQTAFMGKFLNGYAGSSIDDPAPGWDEWHPTVAGVYNYTDFSIGHNGVAQPYSDSYQTDVFAGLAVRTIEKFAASPEPFFLWQSFVAPHRSCQPGGPQSCWGPPVPAPRHRGLFPDAVPPAFGDPSYNEEDVRDKPAWVRNTGRISAQRRDRIIADHRARLRALQSVDQAVGRMVRALADSGRLDNALVIFTSDNGYLHGEHRIGGKNVPYEPALQVPFLMRGPDLPAGTVSTQVAATVDIAPTIAAAAGATPTLTTDGRNLLPVARGDASSWHSLLIQAGREPRVATSGDWFFRGVRTPRYTYVTYPGTRERELYDRLTDPHQLVNVAPSPRYREVRAELARRLEILGPCKGAACRQPFAPLPLPGAG